MNMRNKKTEEKSRNEQENGWKPCGSTHTHTALLNKKINKIEIENAHRLSISY